MSDVSEAKFEEEDWILVAKPDQVSPLTGRILAPTNYVYIVKHGSAVEGQYVLDLSLPPPPPPVPRAVTDKDPKNLSIYTTSGPITTEVLLIHDGSGMSKRVTLDLCTDDGFLHATVHDPSFSDGALRSHTRPSLSIELSASNGEIALSLPRCFRGPVAILTSHDRIAFSPALEECAALLADVPDVRVYFVGERPRRGQWGREESDDEGDDEGSLVEEPLDEILITGEHTSVWIDRAGEEEMKPAGGGWEGSWNAFGRLFTSGG